MALYNQIVFGLLIFEMMTFIALILPLPFTLRRKMFKVIAESVIIAKAQYFIKIAFVFVAVLFVDAVNHMLKIHADVANVQSAVGSTRPDLHAGADLRSRKFLSERNMYLYGFTLFLSLILSRTYSLVLDLIKAQEDCVILRAKVLSSEKEGAGAGADVDAGTKQQLIELQRNFDALAEKYAAATGTVSDKRAD